MGENKIYNTIKSFIGDNKTIKSLDTEFIIDATTHALILFLFLSVFFIVYITKVSKEAIERELENNIRDAFKERLKDLTIEQKERLRLLPYDLLKKMYSEPEKGMVMNNKWLFRLIIIINIILVIVLIGIIILMKTTCNKEINMTHILIENGIAFIFIGIVEYLFFTKIAIKYIPVEPSFISEKFIDTLKNMI